MAGVGGTTTPLRLKDLLELDCESCSAAGFRCYPRRRLGESSSAPTTMRRLLESPSSSLRCRRPSKLSHLLSKSLSRRLLSRGGGIFWRRRDDEEDEDACAAAAPSSGSGSESSGASSSETTSDNSSGRRGSRCDESDSDFSTATTTSSALDSMDATAAAVNDTTGHDEHEAMKSSGSEADDHKEEELSPVAVMDFPSDDDGGDADGERDVAGECSPSFSLARLQRRKMLRPQHKIRRFGSTEELGPVDLETLLAATLDTDDDDVLAQQVIQFRTGDAAAEAAPRLSRNCHGAGAHHETDGHGLIELLVDAASAGVDHVSERLLLDFSIEMKRRRRGSIMEHSEAAGRLLPREAPERLGEDGEVLAAARGWLDGVAGSEGWGLNDVLRGGETVVAEMERSRRWMQVREEEREVGAVVAGMLADQLVDEVVWDLLLQICTDDVNCELGVSNFE